MKRDPAPTTSIGSQHADYVAPEETPPERWMVGNCGVQWPDPGLRTHGNSPHECAIQPGHYGDHQCFCGDRLEAE